MSSVFSELFSREEIDYLLQLPEVVAAKERFGSSNKVQFTIPLTDGIRAALQTRFSLDLSTISEIPMRWIKGDTAAHVDSGSTQFENTYLVYLQDSEGEFVLGTDSYPITANTGFVFKEGTSHKTQNTGPEPRLLLGPMNEFAAPVGITVYMYYFTNYYDAFNKTVANAIADSGTSYNLGDVTTGSIGSITKWRVAITAGTPSPNPTAEYTNGTNLGAAFGTSIVYFVYQSNKVIYYTTKVDAEARNATNIFARSTSNGNTGYTIGTDTDAAPGVFGGKSWRVAYVTNNTAPFPAALYAEGYNISLTRGTAEMYYLYESVVCFLEGTQILCLVGGVETYVPIETMRPGFQVKTSLDGYKKVELIGKGEVTNTGDSERVEDRLYKLSPSNYPELKEDLFITGAHSILVDTITDKQREDLTTQLGRIFVTDKKYRLTAMVDERAEPWTSQGKYTVWHFALEHDNILMNYGVYANGLLVESCSINTMRTKSNLTIV